MDTTPEKRMKFAEVIIRKCDEVSALTNDLFLHALSDMDKLEMNMHEVKLCAFMRKAMAELISDMDSVRLYLPDSEWVISADEKRLMQLTENILNNAAKYGEMPVDITIRQKDNDTVQINFKDYGNGMKDEDIPFALIVVIMFCHRMFLQEKMALVKQQYWKRLMSCWGHILQRLRHMYLPGLCLISNQLMQDERLRFQMIAEFLLLVQSHSILARLVVRLHGILIMSLLVFSVFF